MEYLEAAGRKKVVESTMHGGKLRSGRTVWEKELRYLHVCVEESEE